MSPCTRERDYATDFLTSAFSLSLARCGIWLRLGCRLRQNMSIFKKWGLMISIRYGASYVLQNRYSPVQIRLPPPMNIKGLQVELITCSPFLFVAEIA